jgi:NADPH:quinone reductase-like Zn-dependent oxidoreductase
MKVFGILPPMRGSFAQFVLAPEAGMAIMPEVLSFAEASALPLVGTTCT